MVRIIAVLLAAGAFAAAGPSAASVSARASAAAPPCGPGLARTLADSSAGRIYAVGPTVYGCAAGSRRTLRLGSTSLCVGMTRVGPVAVSGRLAAVATLTCGVDAGSTLVGVRRLTDGATLASHPAIRAVGPETFTSVTGLVLEPAGGVAWIGRAMSIVGHMHSIAVFAAHGDAVRRLDSAATIVPGSLRLHGTTLSWRDGRARRDALL